MRVFTEKAPTEPLRRFINRIRLGHCLTLLRKLPSDCVDAVVSDPPYGLGPREPTAEDIITYLTGGGLDTKGDFMGKSWSLPSVPILREVCRVVKPGGHVLLFSSTRSWDLLSLGMRAVGLERRDTIAGLCPGLLWIQREGMPKGINVEKAVRQSRSIFEAPKWRGWNTALAPSWEPILVGRRPLEGTVVENVHEHGTGALNAGACRVSADGGRGRHPPNLVITHSPGCRRKGTKRVRNRGGSVSRSCGPPIKNVYQSRERVAWQAHGDENGMEVVEDWECAAGCPAAALAQQTARPEDGARFFPQLQVADPPFLYCSKASPKERTLDGRLENDHVSVKPLKLMRWLLRLAVPPGGLVLDMYAGSGTTCHAALVEGMRFIGFERDKAYFKTATERLKLVRGDLAREEG